jgi:hypothetical protein
MRSFDFEALAADSFVVKSAPVVVAAFMVSTSGVIQTAEACTTHRSFCHATHECPSDHHTYRWGTLRLLCTSYRDERTARDRFVVRYGDRAYYCHR